MFRGRTSESFETDSSRVQSLPPRHYILNAKLLRRQIGKMLSDDDLYKLVEVRGHVIANKNVRFKPLISEARGTA